MFGAGNATVLLSRQKRPKMEGNSHNAAESESHLSGSKMPHGFAGLPTANCIADAGGVSPSSGFFPRSLP